MSDAARHKHLPYRSSGAAFEAGLVGHRNARGVERQEPSDGTQEEVVIGGHGLGGSAGCSGGSGSAGGSGRQTVLLILDSAS